MVNERSQEQTQSQNPYFLHCDGDSFFVACELTVRPELVGKPVVVGGDAGIAVAMSKEAKMIGVTRGMPAFQIKKLYPEVILLPHNFALYRDISRKVYSILISYLEQVEVYSIDECFAIIKPSDCVYFGGLEKLAKDIKKEIKETLGVTYSFGIARTKALAKQASKLQKPDGLVVLDSFEAEVDALIKTSIFDVWGIGRKTIPRLISRGVRTAYDFVHYPYTEIEKHFSEPLCILQKELGGESFLTVSCDTDPRDQKSIQSTSTFRPSSTDPKIIWSELARNVERACTRARALRLVSNKVSCFVKTSSFVYYEDNVKLELFSADPGVVLNMISPCVSTLLRSGEKIRSTGVTLHNLFKEEDVPRDLFGVQDRALENSTLECVADKLRAKFGNGIIQRASSLKNKQK